MTPEQLAQRGRPRDAARDTELMDAALALVAEVGYDRVSMEAVAAKCSASKATIYRRWPSKGAMVAAALSCRKKHEHQPVSFSGDIRRDLIDGLVSMARSIEDEDVNLMVGLLGAMRTDPELAAELRAQMVADKRAAAQEWTRVGIAEGHLRPGTDLTLVQDIGPSLVFNRLLVTGEPVDEAFCTQLVDDVLLPLVQPHMTPNKKRKSS